jgi:hypothetical protein
MNCRNTGRKCEEDIICEPNNETCGSGLYMLYDPCSGDMSEWTTSFLDADTGGTTVTVENGRTNVYSDDRANIARYIEFDNPYDRRGAGNLDWYRFDIKAKFFTQQYDGVNYAGLFSGNGPGVIIQSSGAHVADVPSSGQYQFCDFDVDGNITRRKQIHYNDNWHDRDYLRMFITDKKGTTGNPWDSGVNAFFHHGEFDNCEVDYDGIYNTPAFYYDHDVDLFTDPLKLGITTSGNVQFDNICVKRYQHKPDCCKRVEDNMQLFLGYHTMVSGFCNYQKAGYVYTNQAVDLDYNPSLNQWEGVGVDLGCDFNVDFIMRCGGHITADCSGVYWLQSTLNSGTTPFDTDERKLSNLGHYPDYTDNNARCFNRACEYTTLFQFPYLGDIPGPLAGYGTIFRPSDSGIPCPTTQIPRFLKLDYSIDSLRSSGVPYSGNMIMDCSEYSQYGYYGGNDACFPGPNIFPPITNPHPGFQYVNFVPPTGPDCGDYLLSGVLTWPWVGQGGPISPRGCCWRHIVTEYSDTCSCSPFTWNRQFYIPSGGTNYPGSNDFDAPCQPHEVSDVFDDTVINISIAEYKPLEVFPVSPF